MKIAIISSRYPSENNPYNHMFVHMRAVEMKKQGEEVVIYIPGKTSYCYTYEGVYVKVMPSVEINKELENFKILYLHLLNIYPFSKANGWIIYKYIIRNNLSFIMYVHGNEVQQYGARMFEFNYKITDFLKWFKKDVLVIPKMKFFVKKTLDRKNAEYVFPSLWMKNDMEKNLNTKLSQYHIIPNGIDSELFRFNDSYENKFKILTLRPLSSSKYAVDLAIEILKFLPENFILEIYGKGQYEKRYLKQIKRLNLEKRVTINNGFIERKDLNNFFSNYGVFLAPTRMDAQGVSMCEAMSSGLLTVSSNNTAIPEFIEHFNNGIIGNDLKIIAENIIKVTADEQLYKKITNNARASMENIDIATTVKKELELLNNVGLFKK